LKFAPNALFRSDRTAPVRKKRSLKAKFCSM
jgi:hypothetical protein